MLKSAVMLLPSLGKSMMVIQVICVYRRRINELIHHLRANYCTQTHEKTQYAHYIQPMCRLGYSLSDHLTQLVDIFKQHVVVSHGPSGNGDSSLLTLSPGKSVKKHRGMYLWMKSAAAALFRSALNCKLNICAENRDLAIRRLTGDISRTNDYSQECQWQKPAN